MMSMTFSLSTSVKLLFDFWVVDGLAGMLLSVFVVLLLAVFYELLKVWRVQLGYGPHLQKPHSYAPPPPIHDDRGSILNNTPSESSLNPIESHPVPPDAGSSLLLRGLQAFLHTLQVTLGYMLMLCVMSYNTWIFLGVVAGSFIGYFISFPLLAQS